MKRDPRDDPARIARLWDAAIGRGSLNQTDADHDLLRTVRALHASDDTPLPDTVFAHRLEARVKQQWIAQAGNQMVHLSMSPDRELPPSTFGHQERSVANPVNRLRARRFLGVFATIVLILITISGTFLTLDRARDQTDPTPSTIAGAVGTETPGEPDGYSEVAAIVNIPKDKIAFASDQGWAVSLYGWELTPDASFTSRPNRTVDDQLVAADIVTGGVYRGAFDTEVTILHRPLIGNVPRADWIWSTDIPAGVTFELMPGEAVIYPAAAQRGVANALGSIPLTLMTVVVGPNSAAIGTPTVTLPFYETELTSGLWPEGVEFRYLGFGTTPPVSPDESSQFAATIYLNAITSTPGQPLPQPEFGDPDTHPVIWPADLAPGVAGPNDGVGRPPQYGISIRWTPRG